MGARSVRHWRNEAERVLHENADGFYVSIVFALKACYYSI